MSATDIKLNYDNGKYYDLKIVDGDFEVTYGMDSALLLSIYCEKRADASEIPAPEMRRGWWGNTVLGYGDYEMGSKLWLLEQARRDTIVLNLCKTYSMNCFQWLVDDNLAKQINVDTSYIVNGVLIDVEILVSLNKTITASYELWNNTNSL
jgi:phage gp46-like protein